MKLQSVVRVGVVVMLAALAACGPSSAQVATAREARYDAPIQDVFQGVANGTAAANHEIDGMDASVPMLRTVARWYQPDGTSEGKTADGAAMVGDGSILLAFDVAVRGSEGAWYVEVLPVAVQHQAGSPQGRALPPGDPAMPGWVQGKIDSLYVAINAKLSAFAIAPEPAPAP